jgi:hypothetical protein
MYSWLRDGLIPGVSAVLESLWAFAWISFLLATGENTSGIRYPYLWVVAMILLPALFGRWLDRTYWGPQKLRQYGLTTLLVILFAGFMVPYHAAGAAWLAAVALLGRGMWLAMSDITADSASGWFLAGFGAFLLLLALLLVAHPAGWEADQQRLGPLVALYLFGGLSWLALVRRQEMEERAFRKPEDSVNGTWLVLLCGISAAMIVAVGVLSFGGRGLLVDVITAAGGLLALIWSVANYVVVNWLGPLLVWLFGHLPAGGVGGRFLDGPLFRARRPPGDLDARLLAWLRVHIPVEFVLALSSAIILALIGIWLALKYRSWVSGADDEERTSLWSWRLFLAQLREALRGLRRSFAGGHGQASAAVAPEPPQLSSIRQLYAAVLRASRERELPRRPADTPLEFAPVLDGQLGAGLARDLTAAYVHARYAESEPDEDRVADLSRRWQLVRDNDRDAPQPAAGA